MMTPQGHPRGHPDDREVDDILRASLEEDRGSGDLTSEHGVPRDARARARLVARSEGVLAGLRVFLRTFELCDPDASSRASGVDGTRVSPGEELAVVEGNARALLLAERTALNLLQRLSGVATQTARFVAAAGGPEGVRILDTRKTTPGLRALEKYAVRCGGGENHRFGLFDEVLVKENHLALAGCGPEELLVSLRAAVGPDVRITCEASCGDEARAAIRGGADVVMLDNFTPLGLEALCPGLRGLSHELGRAVELEASGGVDLSTVGAFVSSGVDRVSVGALTHSVPALDLSVYLEPLAPVAEERRG